MIVKVRNITGDVKLEKIFEVIKLEERDERIILFFPDGGVLSVNKNLWEVKE